MKESTISNLIERESLKLLTECEKNERYINESIAQLEQQERLYTERVEEVQKELKEERTKLAVLKIQKYGASKALEGKQYDNSLVSNVIRKYDKVRVIANLSDRGEIDKDRERYVGAVGNVVGIDEDYEYPYNIEFEDESLGQDWLWKKEELEFAEGEW